MRTLHLDEVNKRGCIYCADTQIIRRKDGKWNRRACPHEKCPYHETDNYKSFAEYYKELEAQIKKFLAELGKKSWF